MNNLILYWNGVWGNTAREIALAGAPHTAREHAAFDRALTRKVLPLQTLRTRASSSGKKPAAVNPVR